EAGQAPSPTRARRLPDDAEDVSEALDLAADAATRASPQGDRGPVNGQPAAQASTDAPPEWIASKAAADALLDQLERALRRCDASAAVKLYYRANATGAVPLRGDAGLLDRVLSLAVEDRTIDDAAFREFTHAFGCDRPDAATEQSQVRR